LLCPWEQKFNRPSFEKILTPIKHNVTLDQTTECHLAFQSVQAFGHNIVAAYHVTTYTAIWALLYEFFKCGMPMIIYDVVINRPR